MLQFIRNHLPSVLFSFSSNIHIRRQINEATMTNKENIETAIATFQLTTTKIC